MLFSDAPLAFVAYLSAITLTGFMAMVWDKEAARNGIWRVPEQLLLALALVGGSIGIIVGQRAWRHKKQKETFRTYLRMIVIVQFVVLIWLAFPDARSAVWEFLQLTPG